MYMYIQSQRRILYMTHQGSEGLSSIQNIAMYIFTVYVDLNRENESKIADRVKKKKLRIAVMEFCPGEMAAIER